MSAYVDASGVTWDMATTTNCTVSNDDTTTWNRVTYDPKGGYSQTPSEQEPIVDNPGDFILVDGDGVVQSKTYETQAKATKAARRLSMKNDEEYYVYKAVKRVGPKAEVEEEDLA